MAPSQVRGSASKTKTTKKVEREKEDIDYKDQQQSLLCRLVLIIPAAACICKNINVKRIGSLLCFKSSRDYQVGQIALYPGQGP